MPEIILVALLMALGFGAYWSLVLFPRQRDFKQRQQMARDLAEGDEIVTFGGLIGHVNHIDSRKGIAIVEIADGVEIRIVLAAMMQRYDPNALSQNTGLDQSSTRNSEVY